MRPYALMFAGALLLHVVGAGLGSPWATGTGGVLGLGVLVWYLFAADGLPRHVQLWLVGGLLLLAVAVLFDVAAWRGLDTGYSATVPQSTQWSEVLRRHWVLDRWRGLSMILGGTCLVLGVVMLGRRRRRGLGVLVAAAAGPLLVVSLVSGGMLPGIQLALTSLFGSFSGLLLVALAVLVAAVWITLRLLRRRGVAVPRSVILITAGLAALWVPAWSAVQAATASPSPGTGTAFIAVGILITSGPNVWGAIEAAGLLLGAAFVTVGCATRPSSESAGLPAAGPLGTT